MNAMKILKYTVKGCGATTSITCRKHRLLDIQSQGDDLVCWIETKDNYPETTIKFLSVGTGWELPSDLIRGFSYFRTVQDSQGYVWHFYVSYESEV